MQYTFELTISHRGTCDIFKFKFPTYGEASRTAKQFMEYKDLLNGFTIRRLQVLGRGQFYCDKVLWHVRWVPLEQCVKPTTKPRSIYTECSDIIEAMQSTSPNPWRANARRRPTAPKSQLINTEF